MSKVTRELNHRLYVIKRLKSYLLKPQLKTVANGIFISKLQYCLNLFCPIRQKNSDPHPTDLKDLKIVYNKLLRTLTGNAISDKISIKQMLAEMNWSSINQLSIQTRLEQAWKAIHIKDHPLASLFKMKENNGYTLRNRESQFQQSIPSRLKERSFCYPTVRLWNNAPNFIKEAKSFKEAKKLIRKYSKNFPI